MKKLFYLFIAGFMIFSLGCSDDSDGGESGDVTLRADGLYVSEQGSINYFMRFYDDGTVLLTTSVSEADDVAEWLNKENSGESYIQSAEYLNHSNKISFQIDSQDLEVDYSGAVLNNAITLHIISTNYNTGPHQDPETTESYRDYGFESVNFE